jgi:peptidoglycan/xylan/chitin deacetylase (PgdA/CDA1 family)
MSMRFSKIRSLVVLGALAVAVLLALYLLQNPATTRARTVLAPLLWQTGQTVVSLEFDDATADQYAARSLLSSHKLHATFYVNSGTVGSSAFHMDLSEVRNLASDGNEIAGHTVYHEDLLQLERADPDEARREICNDRAMLLKEGFPVTDFAYPYGAFSKATERFAEQCGYDSARLVSGIASPGGCESCPFSETIPARDPYATRTPENVLASTELSTIEGYVKQAQQHAGGWVQIVLHHICDGCGEPYAITRPDLAALLDWLVTQPNTTVATVQQVIGGPVQPAVNGPPPRPLPGSNLLHNPSLEEDTDGTALPDCWGTNEYGKNTPIFSRVGDAHSGGYAERVELSHFADGGASMLAHFDLGGCAPAAVPGHGYTMSAWFKSNSPVLFFIYTRDARGVWSWWRNSPVHPGSSSYAQVSYTTPPLPSGASAISIGLGLGQAGAMTVDDYSLLDRGAKQEAARQ